MHTLFHVLKKGFTLIELMIVVSIIGILASALYPSVTGYFQRAKVVEYQTWASDYIKIANTYNNEVGSLEGPLETAAGEYYYLLEAASTYPSHWHQGFSQFILKNDPNFWNKYRKMRSPSIPSDWWLPDVDSWPLYTWAGVYNIRFPGRDMTSNEKVHALSWFLTDIAPEASPGDYFSLSGTVSGNSNNMPLSAKQTVFSWNCMGCREYSSRFPLHLVYIFPGLKNMKNTKVTLLQVILLIIVVSFLIMNIYPQIQDAGRKTGTYTNAIRGGSSSTQNRFRTGSDGRRWPMPTQNR